MQKQIAVSKWERGVAYPDISVLPQISSYFGVSVDVLLGLMPIEHEYHPSNSGTVEYWENRLEYLKRSLRAVWNEDYMRFLVREIWEIDEPITVLDFGCGYGALGLLIMPLLPAGSKYVGVDFSQTMIAAAKDTFWHCKIFKGSCRRGYSDQGDGYYDILWVEISNRIRGWIPVRRPA